MDILTPTEACRLLQDRIQPLLTAAQEKINHHLTEFYDGSGRIAIPWLDYPKSNGEAICFQNALFDILLAYGWEGKFDHEGNPADNNMYLYLTEHRDDPYRH